MSKKKGKASCFPLPGFVKGDYGYCYQKTFFLDNNSFWFRSIDAFYHFHIPRPKFEGDHERRK